MYELLVDKKGRIHELAVSMTVDSEQFASRVRVPGPGRVGAIELGGDPEVHARLLVAMQNFESHVSFMTQYALRRVFWQEAKQDTVPEAEGEEALVAIRGFSQTRSYDVHGARVRPDVLAGMAERSHALKRLTLVKAFWREAQNEHTSFRYIQAFIASYYVIEGSFAAGRTSEHSVVQAFFDSEQLRGIVAEALGAFGSTAVTPEVRSRLREQFATLQCGWDLAGALKFLFRMRGSLHHFNPRSPRIQGAPLNQDDFEAVALFADFIANLAISSQEVALGTALGLLGNEDSTR